METQDILLRIDCGEGTIVSQQVAQVGGLLVMSQLELGQLLAQLHDHTGGGFVPYVVHTRESAPGCLLSKVGEEYDGGRVSAVYADPDSGVGYTEVARRLEGF